MESKFFEAVSSGNMEALKEILRNNPTINVSWKSESGWTALHVACVKGYDSIVSILLAHPAIDVSVKGVYGPTPFLYCCAAEYTCVRLLLKDSRVKVNEPDLARHSPLWKAACINGSYTIKWWIASGREMDLGTPGEWRKDAILAARAEKKAETVALLERFKENPLDTRHLVRLEIGWYDCAAAEMFALVVFVSDGLLKISNREQSTAPAARFFSIARRLPLELQMIVCHHVVGSPQDIIQGKDSEVAFKSLAESLLWSSFFSD